MDPGVRGWTNPGSNSTFRLRGSTIRAISTEGSLSSQSDATLTSERSDRSRESMNKAISDRYGKIQQVEPSQYVHVARLVQICLRLLHPFSLWVPYMEHRFV